ncbi:MAG: class I adenylate-forming enzyme family protein [Acidimicrobiales bacterium]
MAELLPDQLRLMAAAFGDEVGCTDVGSGESLTFARWDATSNQLARWLVGQGIAKGDRVAIHVPPEEGLAFLISYSAVHKAGAVAVPTSTRLVARELGYVLAHAGAVVAISGASTTSILQDARAELPDLRVVVTTGPASGVGIMGWDDALDPDAGEIQMPLTGDDIADVMYTSGTTGRPKGVVVRHRNVAMVPNGLPKWSGNGWLHASPMFTFAGIASTYNPMKLGMELLYLPRFEVDKWFDIVEQRRPGATFLVPAMAELLIASPRFEDADLSSITICPLGSAPVTPATLQRLQAKLPNAMVSNSWGMTEAGPAFCFMPPEEQAKRIGSVGKPMAPTEFRIVDDDGNELPAREIGELIVRNPGREREYFNDADATAATWREGWLHSGDLAYLDEEGFLYIVGRQKDVIIRGGNNVHATDVESVLYEHPAVQEAAAAGIPHKVLGEDIGAWIVLTSGATASEEDLKAFCAERLSDYKVPRRFTFMDELPRNATGKVVKGELPGR